MTADFRAYCWGLNIDGEVGDGSTINRSVPVPVACDHRFRQISTGLYHTCAVDTADQAWCWGGNGFGQLGDGTTTHRATPVRVTGTLRLRAVRPGGDFTCGLTTADEVWCWGNNRNGAVGDGSTALLRRRPVKVAGGKTYRDVTAGWRHACALGVDGIALCWGDGPLGNGSEESSAVPVPVSGGLRFAQVDAGGRSACRKTSDGVGYCWGSNRRRPALRLYGSPIHAERVRRRQL